MSFSAPLLTHSTYAPRRAELSDALHQAEADFASRMGQLHGKANRRKARIALHPNRPAIEQQIDAWKARQIVRLETSHSARVRPIIQALRDLDQTWERQKMADPHAFIREIATMIGLPDVATRDAIVDRLREIMNPAPLTHRQESRPFVYENVTVFPPGCEPAFNPGEPEEDHAEPIQLTRQKETNIRLGYKKFIRHVERLNLTPEEALRQRGIELGGETVESYLTQKVGVHL